MVVAKKFLDAEHELNFAVASRKTFSRELSDLGLESAAGEIPLLLSELQKEIGLSCRRRSRVMARLLRGCCRITLMAT
ncbi:Protein disulfide-isomerase A3 [Pteropus alecto]|uniref:Protein disulfide-isomerase A3 n=1 Tax=Pteropus alecto TaxID=9402 RepID=L5KI08_PTEAL|nr:Protein disulfide-isomerase A3 [Pteropus alecto]